MIIESKEPIDCLLIGHNEMDFLEYERDIRRMGIQSGAYRDLNLNFLCCNNHPYHISEIYNRFGPPPSQPGHHVPLGMHETFSPAIAYLGTYLQRRGYTFAYVNSFRQELDRLRQLLTTRKILSAAIITTFYVAIFPILEVVAFIREHNPAAKIIVGGPFVSTKVRTQGALELKYLFNSTGADFYVNSSQGEAALVDIITALKGNDPVERINNIYYKTAAGYQATPVSRENNPLAENGVDWSLFTGSIGQYAALRTSISCPFSCAFCGFPEHAGQYRTMSVEAVEKELNQLDKIGTVRDLHFVDDTFNVPVKRFKKILKMMIKNRYRFKWHSYFRCQFADRETVELMKESGCEGVFLGIESGSNPILKNMHKMADVDNYRKGIALLKESAIVTFGNFIVGFPGETELTVKETRDFIKESGLDFYRAQLWYCEPITPIWKQRESYRLHGESFEWSHRSMDAGTASDWVEDLFLSIDTPTWVPQYNFDFDTFWHLVHRGLTLDQAKEFLTVFNRGVRDKLATPPKKEIGFEIIHRLEHFFNGDVEGGNAAAPPHRDDIAAPVPGGNTGDKYAGMFDF